MNRWWCMALLLLAGCGPSSNSTQSDDDPSLRIVEESIRLNEGAEREHIIGHDPTGFPVYGVDDDGQPITDRRKRPNKD